MIISGTGNQLSLYSPHHNFSNGLIEKRLILLNLYPNILQG